MAARGVNTNLLSINMITASGDFFVHCDQLISRKSTRPYLLATYETGLWSPGKKEGFKTGRKQMEVHLPEPLNVKMTIPSLARLSSAFRQIKSILDGFDLISFLENAIADEVHILIKWCFWSFIVWYMFNWRVIHRITGDHPIIDSVGLDNNSC